MTQEDNLKRLAMLGNILERTNLKIEIVHGAVAVVDVDSRKPIYMDGAISGGLRHAKNWKPGRPDYEHVAALRSEHE